MEIPATHYALKDWCLVFFFVGKINEGLGLTWPNQAEGLMIFCTMSPGAHLHDRMSKTCKLPPEGMGRWHDARAAPRSPLPCLSLKAESHQLSAPTQSSPYTTPKKPSFVLDQWANISHCLQYRQQMMSWELPPRCRTISFSPLYSERIGLAQSELHPNQLLNSTFFLPDTPQEFCDHSPLANNKCSVQNVHQ